MYAETMLSCISISLLTSRSYDNKILANMRKQVFTYTKKISMREPAYNVRCRSVMKTVAQLTKTPDLHVIVVRFQKAILTLPLKVINVFVIRIQAFIFLRVNTLCET